MDKNQERTVLRVAGRIPDSFLEQLRDRVDIESLVSSYVELKRRGRTLSGLCPFHNEKTPSFTVYPENNSYYCFGCGAGGDVITFVRSIENLDYVEAVKFLADRAGLRMPEDNAVDDSVLKLKKRLYEANREAARFFHETLYTPRGKEQLAYLERRKVSPGMVKHFGLGAAPDDWHALGDYLKSKGFRPDELVAANLMRVSEKNGKKYYYDAFRNKVMYPVIDLRGNVVAFGGRVLDNSKPKYINTSDTLIYKKSRELFALNFAKNGNEGKLILCEGYMDVIALHEAGFTNAVAGLGTALTAEQVALISRYAKEVSLCYDSDEAGQKAVRAALQLFSKTGVKVRVIRLSGGKDPDEIIRTHGKERFRNLLEGASNDIEYRLASCREHYQTDTDNGKLGYLKEAVAILSSLGVLERDIYAARLSDELGVSKEAILEQLRRNQRRVSGRERNETLATARKQEKVLEKAIDPKRLENLRAAKAEDVLLTTLMNNPSFLKELSDSLPEELFLTDFNRHLFGILKKRILASEAIDVSHLSAELTPAQMGAVARLLSASELVSNTLEECRDCTRVLEEEKAKGESGDPAAMNDDDFSAFFKKLKKE